MTRAIIFLYCQDGFINIPCTKAVQTDDDLFIFYDGEKIRAMFQISDLKGFYISEKKE